MNLYLVSIEWAGIYDSNDAHVIAAPSPAVARLMASEAHNDEGAAVWLDRSRCTVTKIGRSERRTAHIVLTSFCAG